MTTTAMAPSEQKARRFLAIAATLGVLGVAFNLNGDGTLPKILAVAGVVTLIWSIHRFGRLGPDAPMTFVDPEAPRRKKKKKKKKAAVDSDAAAPFESESNDGM